MVFACIATLTSLDAREERLCHQPLQTYSLIACWIGEVEPSLVFPETGLMGFLKPYELDRIASNSFKFAMKKRRPLPPAVMQNFRGASAYVWLPRGPEASTY